MATENLHPIPSINSRDLSEIESSSGGFQHDAQIKDELESQLECEAIGKTRSMKLSMFKYGHPHNANINATETIKPSTRLPNGRMPLPTGRPPLIGSVAPKNSPKNSLFEFGERRVDQNMTHQNAERVTRLPESNIDRKRRPHNSDYQGQNRPRKVQRNQFENVGLAETTPRGSQGNHEATFDYPAQQPRQFSLPNNENDALPQHGYVAHVGTHQAYNPHVNGLARQWEFISQLRHCWLQNPGIIQRRHEAGMSAALDLLEGLARTHAFFEGYPPYPFWSFWIEGIRMSLVEPLY